MNRSRPAPDDALRAFPETEYEQRRQAARDAMSADGYDAVDYTVAFALDDSRWAQGGFYALSMHGPAIRPNAWWSTARPSTTITTCGPWT